MSSSGANLRFGTTYTGTPGGNGTGEGRITCHPGGSTEATIIFVLGSAGLAANLILIALIVLNRNLRKYVLCAAKFYIGEEGEDGMR